MIIEIKDLPEGQKIKNVNVSISFEDDKSELDFDFNKSKKQIPTDDITSSSDIFKVHSSDISFENKPQEDISFENRPQEDISFENRPPKEDGMVDEDF